MHSLLKRTESHDELVRKASVELVDLSKALRKQMDQYAAREPLEEGECPLTWWRTWKDTFYLLAPLARDLLAMPASTADLERTFSHAGRIWTPRRLAIDPKLGSDILFCHENIKLGHL